MLTWSWDQCYGLTAFTYRHIGQVMIFSWPTVLARWQQRPEQSTSHEHLSTSTSNEQASWHGGCLGRMDFLQSDGYAHPGPSLLSHRTVGGAADSKKIPGLLTRGAYLNIITGNMISKAFGCATRPSFYALVLKRIIF